MRRREHLQRAVARAWQRVEEGAWPVALAACGAALAWLIATRVLGHSQPFFAPIAAAIALSTSRIQRSRRIAQMVAGVLLGIGVGELLVALLGSSTVALGSIVFLTMIVALASGVGFFGDGMMFTNQAAVSAILVATVHRAGTGAERAVDVLVGAGVALVLGVVLFPAQPLALLASSESAALAAIARTLAVALAPAAGDSDEEWELSSTVELNRALAALVSARSTARWGVRVAPRRWRLRAAVEAENRRVAYVDVLANSALALARLARAAARGSDAAAVRAQLAALSEAIGTLAAAARPWSGELRARTLVAARGAGLTEDGTSALASLLTLAASDLVRVVEPGS